jgi:aminopeptidase-like protein
MVSTTVGEPMMSKRTNAYPTLSVKGSSGGVRQRMNVLSLCDGKRTALDIADRLNISISDVANEMRSLKESEIVEAV